MRLLVQDRHMNALTTILADLVIVMVSLLFTYLLRFNFEIPPDYLETFVYVFPIVIGVRLVSFLLFKTYAGILKFASAEDAKRIFLASTFGSLVFGIINFTSVTTSDRFIIPFSIVLMEYIFVMFFMTSLRLFYKILYQELRLAGKEKKKVIIYGAGEAGVLTKKTLNRDVGANYKIIGFFDDNPHLANKKIDGVNIYHGNKELKRLLSSKKVDWLIISILNLPAHRKQEVIEMCLQHKVKVLNVPPMSKWINGELSFKQIKKIRIEDLLEREPIQLDEDIIKDQLKGRTVLVTGAAGSIGSEIVRQVLRYAPKMVVLVDQAESALYEMEVELKEQRKIRNYELVLADIRNEQRMEYIFAKYRPQYVYHTAAYKHVPVMESNPSEAVLTNILGTKVVANLSVDYGIDRFVMVSTDKAVNPTNVMGASKRIAEIYVQSLNSKLNIDQDRHTRFITTRFGNVLGSNGSVIQLFRKQIESGGPITVTHPEVTRFFMTIPEACQLVLEAGSMGKGGEIFIFDMGRSVKIVDLARKMVVLSGLELGKDINLVYTGLRPGEKLYEELLADKESTIPTHHEKILKAKVREYQFGNVEKDVTELISYFSGQDSYQIVSKMKEIVPEFVSNNSEFEVLDVQKTT